MNPDTSRVLDRLVGVPLCWLLSCWRRLLALFGRAAPPTEPRRVLFVKLSEMGAIVLSLPAFQAARQRYGREQLYCLMLAGNDEIHELLGVFPRDNIWTIRDRNLWTFATDALRVLRRCRREKIDAVIDLEGFARISAILTYLTGASRRVGMHAFTLEGPYRGDLSTHRVAHNPYLHASGQFLAMVRALESPESDEPLLKQVVDPIGYEPPAFEPTDGDQREVDRLFELRCGGEPTRPLVLLNPNLIDMLPLRSWPRENYVRLARRILADHPEATILLIGLKAERVQSEALAREIASDRVVSLAGDTTLRSLVTLFTRADLLITSDSGPAHMASLTQLPVVALFGPETPRLYAPLGPNHRTLWAGLACSPCFSALNHRTSACRDNVCLKEISVDQVHATAREICPALATPSRSETV